jgi:hypothetical protein
VSETPVISLLVRVLSVGNAGDEHTVSNPGEDRAVVTHADTVERPEIAL